MSKIISAIRKISAYPEIKENIELVNIILDLQNDVANLITEKSELVTQVTLLKEQNSKAQEIKFHKDNAEIIEPYYTLNEKRNKNGKKLMFCLNCLYNKEKVSIMMPAQLKESRSMRDIVSGQSYQTQQAVYGYECSSCNTQFAIHNDEIAEQVNQSLH